MDSDLDLIVVDAPHFYAGLLTDGTIRRAAPILKYTIGWTDAKASAYFKSKGWKATRLRKR